MEKYYITTAIDYVNAKPHIGHAYEKIAADVLARYHRLLGEDVFFQTGLDEHGSKIEKAAKQAGLEPQKFCDQMAEEFKAAWKASTFLTIISFVQLKSVITRLRKKFSLDYKPKEIYTNPLTQDCIAKAVKILSEKEIWMKMGIVRHTELSLKF